MTSGSNWRHLNRPQTEDARRSILPAYHGVTAKLQHFPFQHGGRRARGRDSRHFAARWKRGRSLEVRPPARMGTACGGAAGDPYKALRVKCKQLGAVVVLHKIDGLAQAREALLAGERGPETC